MGKVVVVVQAVVMTTKEPQDRSQSPRNNKGNDMMLLFPNFFMGDNLPLRHGGLLNYTSVTTAKPYPQQRRRNSEAAAGGADQNNNTENVEQNLDTTTTG